MSDAASLLPHGWGWLQFPFGLLAFLLPGVIAAHRFNPSRYAFVFAPIWSFTLLATSGLVLGHFLSLPVAWWSTLLLALTWSVALGKNMARVRLPKLSGRTWAKFGILVGAILVAQSSVQFPTDAQPGLIAGNIDYAQAIDEPHFYPKHVDEYIHMARAAAMNQQRTVDINDPYTGQEMDTGLFTLRGSVHERGFQLGMAQLSHTTGLGLGGWFGWFAPFWAIYLAVATWAALRPHPGAWMSGAAVAMLPTTVLFMGPALMVPIAFGLPWLAAMLHVGSRSTGAWRIGGMMLLITAAFSIHLVIGGAAMIVGLLATILRPGPTSDRLAVALATVTPLLWIGPGIYDEVRFNLQTATGHPWARDIFTMGGYLLPLLGFLGLAVAWQKRPGILAYRIAAALFVIATFALAWSVWQDTNSLATYYRTTHVWFYALAILTGIGFYAALTWLKELGLPPGVVALLFIVPAIGTLQASSEHAQEVIYTTPIMDDAHWQAAQDLPTGRFLSDPWLAPLYNAQTGGIPHTYMTPGSPPVRGDDFQYYLRTSGADAHWLQERDIAFIVSHVAPNATYTQLGPLVYQL